MERLLSNSNGGLRSTAIWYYLSNEKHQCQKEISFGYSLDRGVVAPGGGRLANLGLWS